MCKWQSVHSSDFTSTNCSTMMHNEHWTLHATKEQPDDWNIAHSTQHTTIFIWFPWCELFEHAFDWKTFGFHKDVQNGVHFYSPIWLSLNHLPSLSISLASQKPKGCEWDQKKKKDSNINTVFLCSLNKVRRDLLP